MAEVAERGRGDDMAALEAAADAAGGTRLSGFVSAGVIQQQAPGEAPPAAPGALRAPARRCCCDTLQGARSESASPAKQFGYCHA